MWADLPKYTDVVFTSSIREVIFRVVFDAFFPSGDAVERGRRHPTKLNLFFSNLLKGYQQPVRPRFTNSLLTVAKYDAAYFSEAVRLLLRRKKAASKFR